MNDVSLIGRLTRDPELHTTDNGTDIPNLRVAVDRRRRDDGAVFVDVKCFEGQARACADYLAKGRQVAIDGFEEFETKGGDYASRVYIVADVVEFLASRRDGSQADDGDERVEHPRGSGRRGDTSS
jgi:single-strand DNA-binding protein